MARIFNSSKPDKWTSPRPVQDPSMRLRTHGRVRPMHEPSWLQRLFGRS